jgi:hypothetical protein
MVGSAWVASTRDFTPREAAVFQVLLLIVGSILALIPAALSAEDAARFVLRGSARSAFRRLLTLNRSVALGVRAIEARRVFLLENVDEETGAIPASLVVQALDSLSETLAMIPSGMEDAMADWRDLVPREVAQVLDASRGEA